MASRLEDAVLNLIVAYGIRGQRQFPGEQGAGERVAFRLGQALKRIVRPL